MNLTKSFLDETLAALAEQDIVYVCTACTEKVVVLGCEHGGEVVYSLDGTFPHPCMRKDADGLHPEPVMIFHGAYAGFSGGQLLKEARRLEPAI